MDIQQLIRLSSLSNTALGWADTDSAPDDISINDEAVGDIVLWFEVRDEVMKGDLRESFNDLEEHLNAIWGNLAASIEFCESENSPSGYVARILLKERVE